LHITQNALGYYGIVDIVSPLETVFHVVLHSVNKMLSYLTGRYPMLNNCCFS